MENKEGFHKRLRTLIIEYILLGYKTLKQFPKEERFGMTSQCKRALVSVFLTYVEGYSRSRKKVMLNLYETSYGSLQESIGVFFLSVHLNFIHKDEYLKLFKRKEEIAKMLWTTLEGLREETKNDR